MKNNNSVDSNCTWLTNDFRQEINRHNQLQGLEQGYFVYHLDDLSAHLATLQDQDVVKLWFAVKANPLSSVIQTIGQQNINFDVASSGELEQVLSQDIAPDRILNTGPAKSKKQLKAFLKKGVNTFVIESINQLNWLAEVSSELAVKPDVLLRVQLQWPEGEKNPLGGNSLTPFGLGTKDWQSIKVNDFPSLNICGLHIFQWGNMLCNQKMMSLWSQMIPPLSALADSIGMQLDILDLGGGFGIDYLSTGQQIEWKIAIDHLAEIKRVAGVTELWLELGRYAVASSGYYVAPIVDRKHNLDNEQLVLAGGINHLLRPAITEQPFPAILARESEQDNLSFHVHGPLCTSLDKLGEFELPQDIHVDDALIFGLCGAYGFTESMPFFLCHEIAAEFIYRQGEFLVVREQQSAAWYLR